MLLVTCNKILLVKCFRLSHIAQSADRVTFNNHFLCKI